MRNTAALYHRLLLLENKVFTCTITRKIGIHENRQGNILNTLKLSRQNKIMSSYRILMMLENSMIAVLLINILLKRTPENTLNSSFFKD